MATRNLPLGTKRVLVVDLRFSKAQHPLDPWPATDTGVEIPSAMTELTNWVSQYNLQSLFDEVMFMHTPLKDFPYTPVADIPVDQRAILFPLVQGDTLTAPQPWP